MRASAVALAALEVAVARRGTALAGLQLIGVHAEAHGAARLAPFEPGGAKDLVEPFGLGLLLHEPRARYDHGVREIAGDLLAGHDLGDLPQVLDAPIGARADPDDVQGHIGDARSGG